MAPLDKSSESTRRPFSRPAITSRQSVPLYLTRDADASVLADYLTRNHAVLAPLLPADTMPADLFGRVDKAKDLDVFGACFGEVNHSKFFTGGQDAHDTPQRGEIVSQLRRRLSDVEAM